LKKSKGILRGQVRLAAVILLTVSVASLAFGVLLSGCGSSYQSSSAKEYKKQWTEIMDAFQTRVLADDKKVTALINKNDAAGVIRLVNQRMAYVDAVTGKILVLRPPEELWKVHAVTLYYLTSLKDGFKNQNDFYNAVMTGLPAKDFKTISDQAALRTRAIGAELGVEIQRVGLELKSNGEQPESQQPAQQSATQSAQQ